MIRCCLMIDGKGLLEGETSSKLPDVEGEDLLLYEVWPTGYRVLRDGIAIVRQLNELVLRYDYQLVFHNEENETEQLARYQMLRKACVARGVCFPIMTHMVACDSKVYPNIASASPDEIRRVFDLRKNQVNENEPARHRYDSELHSIQLAVYGMKVCRKIGVRRACSVMLEFLIDESDVQLVLDGDMTVAQEAKREGYRVYHVVSRDEQKGEKITLKNIKENSKEVHSVSLNNALSLELEYIRSRLLKAMDLQG